MHALTTVHDGAELRRLTHEMVLDLLAVGLDPERCALIRQSDFPEHAELAWIFNTCVPVAWAERNPTYKESAQRTARRTASGLLDYPVLQAADIVIYKASRVPGRQGPGRPPRAVAARSCAPSTGATARSFPSPSRSSPTRRSCIGIDGAQQDGQERQQHDPDLRRARRDPATGDEHGHRPPAHQAHRSRDARRSATSASCTATSATTT